MTVRSEGQFNTVVYEDYDLYRGQQRRDCILVHPQDIDRLGLKAESRVMVSSECGSLSGITIKAYEKIKPGSAMMYYPEANILVPRHIDPQSRTPAFKNVLVSLAPARAGGEAKADQRVAPLPATAGVSSRDSMRAC